jgi:hypothetical protein
VSLVSNRLFIGAMVAQNAQLQQRVAQIAAIWTNSDAGYCFLLPALGVQPNYNSGPVAVTLYMRSGSVSWLSHSGRSMPRPQRVGLFLYRALTLLRYVGPVAAHIVLSK